MENHENDYQRNTGANLSPCGTHKSGWLVRFLEALVQALRAKPAVTYSISNFYCERDANSKAISFSFDFAYSVTIADSNPEAVAVYYSDGYTVAIANFYADRQSVADS